MQLDHRIRKAGALLPLLSAVIAFEASEAVRIEIPEHRLEPSGAGARGVMYITNNSEQPNAFQIDVATRSHDLDGNETNVRVRDEWSVLPRQLLLPPHSEKLVSIVWKGPARLDGERAYRVVIQQLPIELEDPAKIDDAQTTSRLKVMTRVRKSLYVTPRDAQPRLVVESAGEVAAADGARSLELVLANRGNAHQLVERLALSINPMAGAGAPAGPPLQHELSAEEFGGRFNVLAGGRRRISLAWPEGLRPGPVEVTLD